MTPIKEIRLSQFDFTPEPMYFGGYKPGVFTSEGGYTIRIKTGHSWHDTRNGRNTTSSYAYFELDATGLITTAPLGLARFKNRVRILDIAEHADKGPA